MKWFAWYFNKLYFRKRNAYLLEISENVEAYINLFLWLQYPDNFEKMT